MNPEVFADIIAAKDAELLQVKRELDYVLGMLIHGPECPDGPVWHDCFDNGCDRCWREHVARKVAGGSANEEK